MQRKRLNNYDVLFNAGRLTLVKRSTGVSSSIDIPAECQGAVCELLKDQPQPVTPQPQKDNDAQPETETPKPKTKRTKKTNDATV